MNKVEGCRDERGEYLLVTCRDERSFKIDHADEHLLAHEWSIGGSRKNCQYALRSGVKDGKSQVLLLHREIMAAPKGMEVDHRDWDCLNDRRYNLRIVTPKQNMTYVRPDAKRKGSVPISGRRGVYPTTSGKWAAIISIDGKTRYLGAFDTVEGAAAAWNAAAIEARGADFTFLNPDCS